MSALKRIEEKHGPMKYNGPEYCDSCLGDSKMEKTKPYSGPTDAALRSWAESLLAGPKPPEELVSFAKKVEKELAQAHKPAPYRELLEENERLRARIEDHKEAIATRDESLRQQTESLRLKVQECARAVKALDAIVHPLERPDWDQIMTDAERVLGEEVAGE